jgi:hypothetical protein
MHPHQLRVRVGRAAVLVQVRVVVVLVGEALRPHEEHVLEVVAVFGFGFGFGWLGLGVVVFVVFEGWL